MSSVHEASPPTADDADPPAPRFPHANCVAVDVLAGVLSTAFGPLSSDKLVVNQLASETEPQNRGDVPADDLVVTSDGATLLEELPVTHPIAPIVRRVLGPERPGDTDVVGQDIPDGVTSTVVLLSALLDEAVDLVDRGVHPHDVRAGYAVGLDAALATLDAETRLLSSFPDERAVEEQVARAAATGNDVGGLAARWASTVVDAVDLVARPTEETFVVRTLSTGAIGASRIVEGAVLDRNGRANDQMPRAVTDATVLLLDGHNTGGLKDPEWDERATLDLRTSSFDDVEDLYAERRRRIVDSYRALGVDVVVCRLGITPPFQKLLAAAGIMGIRSVNRLDMRQLARATGASLVRNPEDVAPTDLGRAGRVEEVRGDPRRGRRKNTVMTVFDECPTPGSVAVVLNGVSGHVATQATTEVRKMAAAVAAARGEGSHRPGVVPGAGAIEMELARAVRARATGLSTKAQLAVEGMADAFETVVATLARNAGADPIDAVADLRMAHAAGSLDAGFLLPEQTVESATEAGVFDPVAYKRRGIVAAFEVADLVLRVDDAIDGTFSDEPLGPDDVIYDDRAENHLDWLDENPGTRWDQP
ncbi:TCP-1/cpn60 chaperonin family protein [Salinigranum halophilum]|uniref:TCP-1/cpn60 chaperonin family protein n=1 Tax=Salinigranum halophilum TaxID=2565931 RepID=UPI0010A93E52|nr:TCP-1/cpn60 chaperonin family protein [Salinigranum halophilum]